MLPVVCKCEERRREKRNHQGSRKEGLMELTLRPGKDAPGRAADWEQTPE